MTPVLEGKIYRGANPVDYDIKVFDKVKTILNLQTFDSNTSAYEAHRKGVQIINLDLPGFWLPSEAVVSFAVHVLNDTSLYPIYVHCRHGRERTGLVVAAWKLKRFPLGRPFERVIDDMIQSGCRWPWAYFYKNLLRRMYV